MNYVCTYTNAAVCFCDAGYFKPNRSGHQSQGGIYHSGPQPLPSVQINLKTSQHDCFDHVHTVVKCVRASCTQALVWSAQRRDCRHPDRGEMTFMAEWIHTKLVQA